MTEQPLSVVSQETKSTITASIRKNVKATQRVQDAADFAQLVKLVDGIQTSKAIRDMYECEHIPVLGGGTHEEDNRSATVAGGGSFTISIRSEATSSIMKSLRGIPRTRGPQTISDHEFHAKQREMGRPATLSTADSNAKLVAATELFKSARKVLDGSRLLFEAGVLYDEIGMVDKAVFCFERCANNGEDAAKTVDSYDLTEGPEFKRKVERMSAGHRDVFLQQRVQLRVSLIAAEKERLRLRSMVSLCQLTRIYLQTDDYANAHRCLVASFHTTVSFAEHLELLLFFHATLKEFGRHFYELSKDQQLVRGSAGSLADAHINILHELLEEDGTNADVCEWLGRRYSERCNFEESRLYFRRARDLRNPVHVPDDLRSLYKNRTSDADDGDAAYLQRISKAPVRAYAFGTDADHEKMFTRGDFAWPNGAREGADTLIYALPPQGWDHGVEAQTLRRERLGTSLRLPPPSKR